MDELALKYLIIGLAIVFVLLIVLAIVICVCQRRKRRRVHLEKVMVESPHLSYKTNLAGISPPTIASRYDNEKRIGTNDGYGNNSPAQIQNGFSQVFRGSPTMPHKNFEAPPPPKSVSPFSHRIENGSLHSIVVIENDENNNNGKALNSPSKSGTTTTTVSPKSASGERLSLKNRPFKLETVETTAAAAASPTPSHASSTTTGVSVVTPQMTRSPAGALKRALLLQKDAMPKDSLPNGHSSKIPSKMEKLQENENEMLFYEFEILNQEAMTSIKPRTTTAELSENIRKNRFYDILPYDFNRVKLKTPEQGSGNRMSDYINASYINTDDGALRYIAAQGPIGEEESRGGRRSNTVTDFWQMIWQERIDTIVMLTECVEGNQQKCALYWPENAGGESITVSGDLSVDLYCITEDDISFQREMFIHKSGEPKRRIMQWHYKAWRDAAGAADADNLLAFMEAIRNAEKCSPILVHCSAGVGRTGVFIALDILLEKLVRENVIDVFETVSRLRESRTSMVQTGEQYLTIYEVIALAIRRRTTARTSG